MLSDWKKLTIYVDEFSLKLVVSHVIIMGILKSLSLKELISYVRRIYKNSLVVLKITEIPLLYTNFRCCVLTEKCNE